MLLQSTLVSTSLGGMLTVYKGIVFLAILIGMRESDFNVLPFQVDNIIQAFGSHVVFQQILQAMTGKNTLTIVDEGQSGIQISIVTK